MEEAALKSSRLQLVKYADVASIVILFFDYMLTFNLEVSLIWPSRLSISKILFFLTRYLPFLEVPLIFYYVLAPSVPPRICFAINSTLIMANLFGIAIAEAILLLRTFALSGRKRKVLTVFGTIYGLGVSSSVVCLSIFIRSSTYGPPPLPIVPGCHLTGGTFLLVGIPFVIVVLNEAALMGYTLWIGVKAYLHSRNPIVVTLFRDGIVYFAFLCLGSIVNLVILLAGPSPTQDLLNGILRIMHSILSARVLLHVRDSDRIRHEIITLQERVSLSTTTQVHFDDT